MAEAPSVPPVSPYDSGGEDEEEAPPKPTGPFAWAAPNSAETEQRVVGWRAGTSLASNDVHEILARDRRARHDYKGLRRASAVNPVQTVVKIKDTNDPLVGLPPTWQAFWSTVPHLDPQAAYKQYRKEQVKLAGGEESSKKKGKKMEKAQSEEGGQESAEAEAQALLELEEEIRRLDEEMKWKKQALAQKEKVCTEWDKKLERVRILDRDEGELSRRVKRKLESASYEYGIMEGKLRSSDIYFHFLHDDGKLRQHRKLVTLRRSHALMGKQIDDLKAEVLLLLRAAMEAQPPSSEPPPSSSERRRIQSGASGASSGEEATNNISVFSSPMAPQLSSPFPSQMPGSSLGFTSP